MLVLPIKKKWFDMIKSGEKKEEYREIKPYYHSRLGHYFICYKLDTATRKVLRNMTTTDKIIIFRNGYSHKSPQIKCKCTLRVGQGKEEWGAEKRKRILYFRNTGGTIMETEKDSYLLNYILNDGALDNLITKCLYGEPSKKDKQELINQISLLQKENTRMKDLFNTQTSIAEILDLPTNEKMIKFRMGYYIPAGIMLEESVGRDSTLTIKYIRATDLLKYRNEKGQT